MEEENVRIKLERHVWPDEKANRKRKKIFVTTFFPLESAGCLALFYNHR
jgi:hypothetical protein